MKKSILIATLFFSCFAACKHNKGINTNNTDNTDKAGPTIQIDSFPLVVGHLWAYDNGDTIRAVSDTIIDGTRAVKLVKTNGSYRAAVYCANMPGGLHIVATNWKRFFVTLTYPLSADDTVSSTLIVPDAPVLIEKLPATITSWSVHAPGYADYSRQWLGYITTTTSAGTFNCVKLMSDSHYEYYSPKGLIKTEDIVVCITSPCPLPATKLVYVNF